MPVAFVHGAGGSKAAFGVGALKYLYEQNIRPDILCGTSGGAINMVKCAEGHGAIAELEAFWLSLRTSADMYVQAPWLTTLQSSPLRKYVISFMADAWGTLTAQFGSWWKDNPFIVAPAFALAYGMARDAARTDEDLKQLRHAVEQAMAAHSVFSLAPVNRAMRGSPAAGLPPMVSPEKIIRSGTKLRLSVVGLEDGALRYVTETGTVLERDNENAAKLARVLKPVCQTIMDQMIVLQSEFERLRAEYSLEPGSDFSATPGAKAINEQLLAKSIELKACTDREGYDHLSTVDLISGVIASCSIPGAFPPTRLGDQYYVDGGVREMIPLEAAVQLGANEVYAILLQPPLPPASAYKVLTISKTLKRALTEIMLDEIAHEDVRAARKEGVTVSIIRPTVDLFDGLVVDSGLIAIAIAYGYMRAADVLAGRTAEDPAWKAADKIVELRTEIWTLECRRHGKPVPTEEAPGLLELDRDTPGPDKTVQPRINELKQQVHVLVEERRSLGGVMPADASRWRIGWERHPWPTFTLPAPKVQIRPSAVPLNTPVITTVLAYNDAGAELWGDVLIEGVRVGYTGMPFIHTYEMRLVDEYDPETRRTIKVPASPQGVVVVEGYNKAAFDFAVGDVQEAHAAASAVSLLLS